MADELKDKVAFITGAVGGLGKAITEGLLANGVMVYMNDINAEEGESVLKKFQTQFGSHMVCFSVMDVTSNKHFQEVFDRAVKTFGNIDFMINNAGVLNEIDFNLAINVGLGGAMNGTRIAENHMRKDRGGKGGRIVNICSVGGYRPWLFNSSLFCHQARGESLHDMFSSKTHKRCWNQGDKRELGLEYAALCPTTVQEGLSNQRMDDSNLPVEYQEIWEQTIKAAARIPVSRVVDGLVELLTLKTMNGAILRLDIEENDYLTMEPISHGKTYPSPTFSKNA